MGLAFYAGDVVAMEQESEFSMVPNGDIGFWGVIEGHA
jgi:hypothetical protein